MKQAAGGLAKKLAAGREMDKEELSEDIRRAGGARAWMQAELVTASAMAGLPRVLSREELLEQTRAYYRDAEARALTCVHECPPQGGACAHQNFCLSPGEQPWWDESLGRMSTRVCDRWQEYSIRRSLMLAGVDERSCGLKLADVQGNLDKLRQLSLTVARFGADALGGSDRWMIVHARAGSGKAFAVGILRKLRQSSGRALWYVSCDTIAQALRDYYEDKSQNDDPLERPRSYQFVTFDALNPKHHPEWLRQSLDEVLSLRWRNCQATLIVTQASLRDLCRGYPRAAEAFSSATLCKVE